jgi:hypothetical protein
MKNLDSIINFSLVENSLLEMDLECRIEAINQVKEFLHKISPFKDEPVDFVKWVKREEVVAND